MKTGLFLALVAWAFPYTSWSIVTGIFEAICQSSSGGSITDRRENESRLRSARSRKFYCKYCGASERSIASLTAYSCGKHPNGPNTSKHALYAGDEQGQYECKYCGASERSIASLTSYSCPRYPLGINKGRHEPTI